MNESSRIANTRDEEEKEEDETKYLLQSHTFTYLFNRQLLSIHRSCSINSYNWYLFKMIADQMNKEIDHLVIRLYLLLPHHINAIRCCYTFFLIESSNATLALFSLRSLRHFVVFIFKSYSSYIFFSKHMN